jgi:hypothetical protein
MKPAPFSHEMMATCTLRLNLQQLPDLLYDETPIMLCDLSIWLTRSLF